MEADAQTITNYKEAILAIVRKYETMFTLFHPDNNTVDVVLYQAVRRIGLALRDMHHVAMQSMIDFTNAFLPSDMSEMLDEKWMDYLPSAPAEIPDEKNQASRKGGEA